MTQDNLLKIEYVPLPPPDNLTFNFMKYRLRLFNVIPLK